MNSKYTRQIIEAVGFRNEAQFDEHNKRIKDIKVPIYKVIGKRPAQSRTLKEYKYNNVVFSVLVSEGQHINPKKAYGKISR